MGVQEEKEKAGASYMDKGSLYELLPAVYRQHEFDLPGVIKPKPLRDLLSVIEEQVAVLESDIARLYDNWFIETCQEWVVPYIADMLGVKGIRPVSNATYSQRAWVANTLSHRQRKGTLATLEQLAHDVTDWNAKAVEFFQYISAMQNVNHVRPAVTTCNMRNTNELDLEGSPFDTLCHTVDVRHIATGKGLYNIPSIGIFLWRLQAYHVDGAPAYNRANGKFTFDQLGRDIPLFTHPETEQSIMQITQEVNVPGPVRRWALHDNPELYCGAGKSIDIIVDGKAVDHERIVACDLTDWHNRPAKGKVAVDPVLGRILFPAGQRPKEVLVDYYYGFSGEVGGGSYLQRDSPLAATFTVQRGSEIESVEQALKEWKKDPKSAIIEIDDSSVYRESIDEKLNVPSGVTLVIRAGEGKRPVLRLAKTLVISSSAHIDDAAGIILEGLMVQGPDNGACIAIRGGDLSFLRVRHCTLVPDVLQRGSIEVKGGNDQLTVSLERTITGRIIMEDTDANFEAKDSIIDSKGSVPALSCYGAKMESCTIFGSVNVVSMDLASNCIFAGPVTAERRQKGCIRFCYVVPNSRLPRRYRCQPVTNNSLTSKESEVRPHFVSENYGEAGYAQLHTDTDREIIEGADDGNEMGVFNHLKQRHRLDNLSACLDEYLRFGLEAGVFLVT